jgi:2-haloacid dehalogenase
MSGPRALLFDVFGTVVDWRGSVIAAGEQLAQAGGVDVDWGAFADEWRRDGYLRPIGRIVTGEATYEEVAVLMRRQLESLVGRFGLEALGTAALAELEAVWQRLAPWPDAVPGLTAMRERAVIAPLSNGGFSQLVAMARHAGLPWDCIISTSLFGTYKPDPRTYRGAAALLELDPGAVMLVAAHPLDLEAAQQAGLRAAYVPRPLEWGPDAPPPAPAGPSFDLVAEDFVALAEALR